MILVIQRPLLALSGHANHFLAALCQERTFKKLFEVINRELVTT